MNKLQDVRNLMVFEPIGGSKSMFWIKAKHPDEGEIKCLSNNANAKAVIDSADKGSSPADRRYTDAVTALWYEVCDKNNLPKLLPTTIRSINDLCDALNKGKAFDYMSLMKRGIIEDIADPTSKYICKSGNRMIYKNNKGKFSIKKYNKEEIATYIKEFCKSNVNAN